MLSLALATLFSSAFGLIVRDAQGRRCNMWAVGAVNYAVASAVNLALQARTGDMIPSWPTALIGVLGGVSYVVAYFVLFELMAIKGVAISAAVTRLAVLFPVVASLAVWGVQPTTAQWAGSLLAVASLPLLGARPPARGAALERRAVRLLGLLFVLNGVNLLAVYAFRQTGIVGESSLFLGILFGAAALVGAGVWYAHREGSGLKDLLPGAALGMSNVIGNQALIAALGVYSGFLVFPVHSAVGLALSVVAARLLWGERVSQRETAGIAVALVAAVFINLG